MLAEAADMETVAASAFLAEPPQPLERSLGRPRRTERKVLKTPDEAFRELKQQHVDGVSKDHHMDWIYWNANTASWRIRVKVSNTQFELRDLMSGQQVFKTRLYGAIVTTLVTRLLWGKDLRPLVLEWACCWQAEYEIFFPKEAGRCPALFGQIVDSDGTPSVLSRQPHCQFVQTLDQVPQLSNQLEGSFSSHGLSQDQHLHESENRECDMDLEFSVSSQLAEVQSEATGTAGVVQQLRPAPNHNYAHSHTGLPAHNDGHGVPSVPRGDPAPFDCHQTFRRSQEDMEVEDGASTQSASALPGMQASTSSQQGMLNAPDLPCASGDRSSPPTQESVYDLPLLNQHDLNQALMSAGGLGGRTQMQPVAQSTMSAADLHPAIEVVSARLRTQTSFSFEQAQLYLQLLATYTAPRTGDRGDQAYFRFRAPGSVPMQTGDVALIRGGELHCIGASGPYDYNAGDQFGIISDRYVKWKGGKIPSDAEKSKGHWVAAIGQLPVMVKGTVGCNEFIVASLTDPPRGQALTAVGDPSAHHRVVALSLEGKETEAEGPVMAFAMYALPAIAGLVKTEVGRLWAKINSVADDVDHLKQTVPKQAQVDRIEEQLKKLVGMAADSGNMRSVYMILGAPGMGKTTLAKAFGWQLWTSQQVHSTFFADLKEATSIEEGLLNMYLAFEAAEGVGNANMESRSKELVTKQICTLLQHWPESQRLCLVIDNAEGVVSSAENELDLAATLSKMLECKPMMVIIITSRTLAHLVNVQVHTEAMKPLTSEVAERLMRLVTPQTSPESAAMLAKSCANIPYALRLVGDSISESTTAEDMLDELTHAGFAQGLKDLIIARQETLGRALIAAKQFDKAIKVLEDSLPICEKECGKDSRITWIGYTILADAFEAKGDFIAASRAFETAHSRIKQSAKRRGGQEGEEVFVVKSGIRCQIALNLELCGRLQEADDMHTEAVRLRHVIPLGGSISVDKIGVGPWSNLRRLLRCQLVLLKEAQT
ncbi:hypothetical protein WJX79_010493 [Trebouxia sp. C0005]